MKILILTRLFCYILLFLLSFSAIAGIQLSDEDSDVKVTISGRLQAMAIMNDNDYKPDEGINFRVRRARLRAALEFNSELSMVFQGELSNGGSFNGETDLIDAYIKYKPDSWLQVIAGLNMAPAQRQNLTSAGSMLALDRPGITNYNLTWGMKGNTALQTGTVPGTKITSFGRHQVRDKGITLFGTGQLNDNNYLKYYLSINEGSRFADDTNRYTARFQWNIGDQESGYYNLSSYLGKKETTGFAIALDRQESFATNAITAAPVDYHLITVDAFIEKPWAEGYLNLEAAYVNLDLDDVMNPLADFNNDPLSTTPANRTQGEGFYVQAGYLVGKWQPWILLEQWHTDAPESNGSWQSVRLGATYHLFDQKASVKVGLESTRVEGTNAMDILTAALGLYMSF